MKKTRKIMALLVSAIMLVSTVSFAEYPQGVERDNGDGTTTYIYGPWAPETQPLSKITETYPSKLYGKYGAGENAFKNKWYVDGVLKNYSNPEKRFVVDGKNFILLDKDSEGNYFVIADDLYGTKPFVLEVGTRTDTSSPWFQAHLNGTWIYDPENTNSVAYWLNNEFLTSGNKGIKLPDGIISNLVEKEWDVEGGSALKDSYFYKAAGLDAPKYTSIAPYKVTQKVSLLSATEYNTYWDDISPLVYGIEPNTNNVWNYNHWMLRTASNNEITVDYANNNAIYIHTGNGILSGMNSYNSAGIRPCFWLDKDFFKTVKLDSLNENATYVMAEINNNSIPELIALYGTDALKNAGYTFNAELNPQNVYIKGQAVAGNTIEAKATTSADSVSYSWLHSGTKDGEYKVVSYSNTLTLQNSHKGFMKVMAVAENQGDYSEPSYSPVFEVSALGTIKKEAHTDTTAWPIDTPEKEKFYVDGISSKMKEWIVLDKVYGSDGKAQLFVYSDLAQAISTWDAGAISQKYDIATPGTFAYKLANNAISGDPARNIDAKMFNAAKLHNWRTEAGHPDVYPDDHFIASKMVPLSAWEYEMYHEKIGAQPIMVVSGESVSDLWLRSPGSDGTAKVARIRINNSISHTAADSVTATWALSSRPAMYLGIEYFGENKLATSQIDANATIYDELKKYFSYEDLYELYTAEEISAIGVKQNDAMPGIRGVKINGILTVGSTVKADYEFNGTEGTSKYQWYAMGASGVYEAIPGATAKTYTLTEAEMGREILVEVIPVDENGVAGLAETAFTKAVVQSELLDGVTAEATMEDKTVDAVFTIKSSVDTTYQAVIAIYTDNNVLVDSYIEPVNVVKGENEYPVEYTTALSGGTNCKVMLLNDMKSLKPVCDFATAGISK